MVINLKIKNFRSIRNQIIIDFIPTSRLRHGNHSFNIINKKDVPLLSSLILYGRNAAGKSNVLRAFKALQYLVKNSDKFKHQEKIPPYEPYRFDKKLKNMPVELEIEFIAENNLKYTFSIKYSANKILYEALYFYPKGIGAKLFERKNKDFLYGEYFKGEKKSIENDLLENQLFISKSANNNIQYLKEAYLFFTEKLYVSTFHDIEYDRSLINSFSEMMLEDNTSKTNIRKLLKAADTNILDFEISKKEKAHFKFPTNIPEDLQKEIIENFRFEVKTSHNLFDKDEIIGKESLRLEDESLGTKKLLIIGGLVLKALKNSNTIVIDELDKSLHPLLSRMLINLFHSKENNPNNSQLIFATHDSSLLDSEMFRRDQICFVDKEFKGNTIFYKLSDIKGVRKNIPFDKWYLSGRFDAIPVINDVELEY
jgi:AAA15 family ATPase/GTPase